MVQIVKEGTSDYVNVWRGFVNGTRNFEKHIHVVGIYKKNYQLSVIDDAREEAFRVFAAAVEAETVEIRTSSMVGMVVLVNRFVRFCVMDFVNWKSRSSA
ncbi:hypothetical protein L2E82_09094 [Cichorium intybus]|uniref:Uncharacterized protein n=1 Tax=Cichorium intybus TaxID=13427 RepID=A0ACB9G7E1_CICIN|nr:hypothetical protein L2E82_09094 [Cichorium intybus]